MKKTNQNKKSGKVLAATMFAVGFVTPLMLSSIAEAANFGAGGSGTSTFTAAQIDAAYAYKSTGTSGTNPISDSNCLMINGYRFKVVGNTTTNGKQILTLWSYDAVDHSGTLGFGTSKYSSGTTWCTSPIVQTKIRAAYNNNVISTNTNALLTVDTATGKATAGKLYGDDASKNIVYIPYTSTGRMGEADVSNAYIWVPSRTEVTSAAWGDGTYSLNNAQRSNGDHSWLRSPYATSDDYAYYVYSDGILGSDVGSDYRLRPALQILNQTSYVFTTNVTIPTNGLFTADGSGTATNYALNSTATIVPTFTPATDGVTLDGTKIGIKTTDNSSGTYAMAGLLTGEADSAKNDTWANLNGPSATSTKGISYMAQVSSNELDLSGVATGTDYTLKVFGLKTADTTVTELASGAITGLSKGADGVIHMKVSSTVNNGVAVTLKGGAVVDLAGDASNPITVFETSDAGKLNLGTSNYTYSGNITDNGTLTVEGTGTLEGTISGAGKIVIDGTVSADADKFTQTGGLEVASTKELTLTAGILSKDVTNNGTVKLNGATLGGAYVTAGTLEFAADTTVADASYISTATNIIDTGINLTLKTGTLGGNLGGTGNVVIGDGTEQTVKATVAQLNNSGTLSVAANGTLELTAGTLSKAVTNNGTVKLNGATLGGAHVTAGTLEFAASTTVNADYVAAVTNKVDSGVTLELTEGTLSKDVTNGGTVKLNGATLGGAHVTSGTLEFAADAATNADYVAAANNKVDSGVTLELTDGTLSKDVTNTGTVKLNGATLGGAHVTSGTLEFAADAATNADYVAADSNIVDSGKVLTLTEGTLGGFIGGVGKIIIDGTVSADADKFTQTGGLEVASTKELILTAGILSKDVTNNGTVKTNGNVIISGNLNGGTEGKLVVENGLLVYTGNSITNDVEIKDGATMDPIADVFAAGTTVNNSGTLEVLGGELNATIVNNGGGEMKVNAAMNFTATGKFIQAEDSNIIVSAPVIEADTNDASKAFFQGINNANQLDVGNGNLTVTGQIQDGKYYVLVAGTAINAGTVSDATLWKMENIYFPDILMADYEIKYDTNIAGNPGSVALKVRNAVTKEEGNTSGQAAVQQGSIVTAGEIAGEIISHLGNIGRAVEISGTAEDIKGNEAMSDRTSDEGKYKKNIWASYIRTKETTEGMKLEGMDGNNTAQYNGAVVGVDFYSSKKAIAGMALSYTTGDINSYSNGTSTVNKSKYYGISFYDRVTNGNNALIYDIGYIRGDNDISQFYTGKETTSDVKTDTYTAGIRYEAEFGTEKSRVVPFASFRYMRQNNKDYTNSHGTKFETKNQNLYIPKVGIAWTGDFVMPKSVWTWRPSVEAGYVWNLGDRNAESNIYSLTKVTGIDYDTVDKSSYYAKLGMEFMCKNFTAGVFYRYLKGSAVRNNKWNVNVSWAF